MKKHGFKKLLAGLSAACVIGSALPAMSFAAETELSKTLGDSNGDGVVELADAILIMQALANPNKYSQGGSDPLCFKEQGWLNADCDGELGVTGNDALTIQLYLLGKGKLTPVGSVDPVTEATKIHLKNTSIEVEGENAVVEGTKVTITHSGEFYIDGTLDDGQIEVNIPDEAADPDTVKIFLNGANITGKSAPAILVTNAENTSINIVDGTTNSISDGDTAYAGDNLKAAVIEAKDDVTIKGGDKGDGVLEITANTQDAVSCNNDIKFNGGTVNITTLNSTDGTDAVKAKKSVTVKDGVLNIDSEGDGIKSSKGAVSITGGNTSIKAGKDAVQAETSIDVSGGTLIAGGDRGLTAVTAINITGGTVIATATDNQADEKLMAGTTQTTVLLNCINDATNEKDGTWKKANALAAGSLDVKYTKKYKYVLYSDTAINGAKSCGFKNLSTGASVTHTDGKQTQFQLSLVTTFNNVDPSGTGGTTVVEPTPAPEGLTITLADSGMTTNASSEAKVENNVCTIEQPGVFTVTGGMTGGQIVVDVDKTVYPDGVVELDLSGMSLTNTTNSPIYVASIADEVVIVAKNGTENTISDGTSYTNADGDTGAIYSKDDIKFKGKGKLTVNGNAADAIVGKDDIKIYNGTLVVNAADDGIRGKDSVTVGNTSDDGTEVDYSTLSVSVNTKAGDGIKATSTDVSSTAKQVGIVTINGGTVDIESYADGISAEQFFVMNGGDLNIKTYEGSSFTGSGTTTGGNTGGFNFGGRGGMGGMGMDGNSNKTDISAKGIKAVGLYDEAGTTWQSVGDITINGGTVTIDSSDDCLHCGGDMQLIGGELKLSSADDGAHADHNLTIGTKNSGKYDDIVIAAEKCYEGIEAQKIYQNSGSVIVNSTDDGFNAAGGSDGSGTGNTGMPWGQGGGGFGGGGFGGNSGDYILQFNGGLAIVNAANGDHDGFDSNGNIEINGGYLVSNGNEPFDCGDGGSSIIVNGGTWITDCPSGGMAMGGSSMSASVTASANVGANTRLSLVGSDGKVIVSFIVDKSVSQLKAGGTGTSGASFYTGGTLSGSAYFQQLDQTQLAAYGGTLTGGTRV